jgi:WD40 repeat protein
MAVPKILSVAFAQPSRDDGNQTYLAAGQEEGGIVLFNGKVYSGKLQGHEKGVRSVAFSNSSSGQDQQQLLASGSADHTVRLWDTHTRECVAVLKGHTGSVNSVTFSPDGRLLASASADRTVRLWNVVERQPVHVFQGHTNIVNSVSFSPDGQQLASGSHDGTVRLWSVPEGVPGPVFQHGYYCVYCVAFSPVVGSNVLASGGSDGIIKLWDVSEVKQQKKPMRELQGHSNIISSVAFSPDGSQLVSGSSDDTARLWSVASGKLLKTLTGHSNYVRRVAFHPNGKQVVSSSTDHNVRIWTVCEWSDRTHHLFGPDMKRPVFCLMCIKDKIDSSNSFNNEKKSNVPQLPMALWLEIFACL